MRLPPSLLVGTLLVACGSGQTGSPDCPSYFPCPCSASLARTLAHAEVREIDEARSEVTLLLTRGVNMEDAGAAWNVVLRGPYVLGLPCDPRSDVALRVGDEVLASVEDFAAPRFWIVPWQDPLVLGPSYTVALEDVALLEGGFCAQLFAAEPEPPCDDTVEDRSLFTCAVVPGERGSKSAWFLSVLGLCIHAAQRVLRRALRK